MAQKVMLIDTSKCTACRGCQVACKQWNCNEALKTQFVGTYQNPQDLNWTTFTLVRFNEFPLKVGVQWLFTKDQCRHCEEAGCIDACPLSGNGKSNSPLYKDPDTGAVDVNNELCGDCNRECYEGCPYEIPRFNGNEKKIYKCNLCNDRLKMGMLPACAQTCPTGTVTVGDKAEMVAKAKERLAELKKSWPQANAFPGFSENVIWLLLKPSSDHQLVGHNGRTFKSLLAKNMKGFGLAAALGAVGMAIKSFRERGER